MNLSAPFIARPVATTLLTVGLALAGAVAERRRSEQQREEEEAAARNRVIGDSEDEF